VIEIEVNYLIIIVTFQMISEFKRQHCKATTANGSDETCMDMEEPHTAGTSSENICEQYAAETQTTSSSANKGN